MIASRSGAPQEECQVPSCHAIERKAEGRPPSRHSGVCDELTMEHVEDGM
jgi:hypothetical protein